MSEAGGRDREWRFYVDDMITFARKVERYTEGLDQAGFVADDVVYDATLPRRHTVARKQHSGIRGRLAQHDANHEALLPPGKDGMRASAA